MTVADNIAYGRPSTTREEIEAATKSAHIHDFVSALPKGYETSLGDNASLVSGGQAQRMQIARALVQPRELLILDECTSALDATNQKLVLDTILKVKTGRTTLIVTHKLAVMEQCDRIVVVQDGVAAETCVSAPTPRSCPPYSTLIFSGSLHSGSVAELRAKPNGVFAQLASGGEWESS
jgi:ATP-binding cassette subfamily B (MDR/TAP) protein 1